VVNGEWLVKDEFLNSPLTTHRSPLIMDFTILRFDSLESTNTEAANQAKRGGGEGLCILAANQTAGRGRHGRSWISQTGAGLYLSIVLRPKIETRFLPLITLMSAVAVYETLSEFDLSPDIKWANDVHVNGKKICGILAETCETNVGLAVIIGIGINLKTSNFPPQLTETATSIEAETGKTPDAEKLLQTVTRFFAFFYNMLNSADGAEQISRQWSRRSSYDYGKQVSVAMENETIFGTTRGIEADGALRIETAEGEIKIVRAGDVERLRTTNL